MLFGRFDPIKKKKKTSVLVEVTLAFKACSASCTKDLIWRVFFEKKTKAKHLHDKDG